MTGVDKELPQNVYALQKLMIKLDCLCVAVGRWEVGSHEAPPPECARAVIDKKVLPPECANVVIGRWEFITVAMGSLGNDEFIVFGSLCSSALWSLVILITQPEDFSNSTNLVFCFKSLSQCISVHSRLPLLAILFCSMGWANTDIWQNLKRLRLRDRQFRVLRVPKSVRMLPEQPFLKVGVISHLLLLEVLIL